MLKKIYHLGYSVYDLEASARFYEDNFGAKPGEPEEVPEQGIRATTFQVGESMIELVQPTRPDSPVGKFLENRGEGFHHVAFEVDDLDGALGELQTSGVDLYRQRAAHRRRRSPDGLRAPQRRLRGPEPSLSSRAENGKGSA